MAWRLSPVTEPSWARTTCTQEALGTDQIRIVASGEAENTSSYTGTIPEGSHGKNSPLQVLPAEGSTRGGPCYPDLRKQGKSQTHLGWVEDDAGDFLGVAFERGQDLLRALVKHDDVFVGSTWKTAGMGVWGQPTPNPPALCFLSPFKFPKARRMRPTPRWEVPRKAPLPVRILLVSEGHRSKARIPGILALCSPCVREENAKLMPQAVKQS